MLFFHISPSLIVSTTLHNIYTYYIVIFTSFPQKKRKRSIMSILTKKYLIASSQALVCGNGPAGFLTKAIDLPENSTPCHYMIWDF